MNFYQPKSNSEDLALCIDAMNTLYEFMESLDNDHNDPCSEDCDSEKDELCSALSCGIRTMFIHSKKLCIELGVPFESLKGE